MVNKFLPRTVTDLSGIVERLNVLSNRILLFFGERNFPRPASEEFRDGLGNIVFPMKNLIPDVLEINVRSRSERFAIDFDGGVDLFHDKSPYYLISKSSDTKLSDSHSTQSKIETISPSAYWWKPAFLARSSAIWIAYLLWLGPTVILRALRKALLMKDRICQSRSLSSGKAFIRMGT